MSDWPCFRQSHTRPPSHSRSFDRRRPLETFLTAMATAFFWPTNTTTPGARVSRQIARFASALQRRERRRFSSDPATKVSTMQSGHLCPTPRRSSKKQSDQQGGAGRTLTLKGSITFDNGSEFARHGLLASVSGMTTWFCDAYASWQKGSVENTNGRLRRHLPRQLDLDTVSRTDLQEIVLSLNLAPRKCLGYVTPIQAFFKGLGREIEIRFA